MYLSEDCIKRAVDGLEGVHPFFGISFLVFKLANLPVGSTIPFAVNREEHEFLRRYYRPDPRSDWYFRPFRVSDKSKHWWRPDHAGKGSQSLRTRTFADAFIHEKGTDLWGWERNYIDSLRRHLVNGRPIPAFDLAVWLFRDRNWPQGTTPRSVVDRFFSDFNINSAEIASLFDASLEGFRAQGLRFERTQFSWADWSEEAGIPPPPDAPHEEGGTLSCLAIAGVGPARRLELELAQRMNLFTGDNGLGKSFLLDTAWWALSGMWPGYPAYPREDAKRAEPSIRFEILSATGRRDIGHTRFDWEQQEWFAREEHPAIPGLLVYARVDGAFAVWDPVRDFWATRETSTPSRPLIFRRDDVWNGLHDKAGDKTVFLSNGLIADWINWQNSPQGEPFKTMCRVLHRLSPPDLEHGDLGALEPGTPTRVARDSRLMPTIRHSYGEVPLVHASAGVQRIVALAYLIVWAWEEHKAQSSIMRREPDRQMVILIDEIEAHLHPKWQRRIVPALLELHNDLHSDLGIQLLIATHSPLVMVSVESVFDATRDKVFHFDLAQHGLFRAEVEVREEEFTRYGTVDSWLKSESFELLQARSEEAERAIEDAKALLQKRSGVAKDRVEEVSQRLVSYLPPHDQFWPRWTYFAEQHGVLL